MAISKIFSLRNYVMKQIMKTNEEGIIKIPDSGKIDFGEMIIKEELFKKGIDPKTITNSKQLDNILNTPTITPHSTSKKSGEVINVDFDKGRWKDIDPEDFAGGGIAGMLGEPAYEDDDYRVPYQDGKTAKKSFVKLIPQYDEKGNLIPVFSKTGKQQIEGAPEGITSDKEVFNLIVGLDIPINDKINILGDIGFSKFRDKIEKGDEELGLYDQPSNVGKNIGIGYEDNGLSGSITYNPDTKYKQFQISKKFNEGGRVSRSSGGIMKLLKLLKSKPKKSYENIDLEKLLKGKDKIPVYSGSMERSSNTLKSFIEDAKLLGTTPEKIAKDKFKGQWFTPFRSYAEMFANPKDLTSKMRTVDLDPKEIAIAKRYVKKVNKKDIISMRKKHGIKPYPKHHITTDENLVLIPRYKLKKLEKENRIMTDYLIKDKIKSKLGLAKGGVAGMLGE